MRTLKLLATTLLIASVAATPWTALAGMRYAWNASRAAGILSTMTQPSTNDNLVRVASYVNVAQADLACARLAMDGIPARLGNAVFLLWCWHFSRCFCTSFRSRYFCTSRFCF